MFIVIGLSVLYMVALVFVVLNLAFGGRKKRQLKNKDDVFEWYGASDSGFWQWVCPEDHCGYFSRTMLKVTGRIYRWFHIRRNHG